MPIAEVSNNCVTTWYVLTCAVCMWAVQQNHAQYDKSGKGLASSEAEKKNNLLPCELCFTVSAAAEVDYLGESDKNQCVSVFVCVQVPVYVTIAPAWVGEGEGGSGFHPHIQLKMSYDQKKILKQSLRVIQDVCEVNVSRRR